MLVHQEGQLQLGAHTVGAGDQHRLFHAGQIGGKHTAEAAQSAHDAGDVGGFYHGLDALDRLISGGDVHAGGGVGLRVRVFHAKTSKYNNKAPQGFRRRRKELKKSEGELTA